MELVLILVVALLVLGPKRMPELARTLGRGLSEFRRASNDLRQSLALDDLQNDLREGIAGAGKIHRPAQAGDELPSGEAERRAEGDETSGDSEDAAADSATHDDASGIAEADSSGGQEQSGEISTRRHPGELPFGNETEHHDQPEESGAQATSAAADPELGNVPVGRPGADRSERSDDSRG